MESGIALSDVVEHLYYFSQKLFGNKRVFMKTTCSPGDPPSDLQIVKKGPAPATTNMSTKWAPNPQI